MSLKIKFRDENGNVKSIEILELDLSCSSSSLPTGSNPEPTGSTPEPTGSTPEPTGSTPEPTGSTPTPTGSTPQPTGSTPSTTGSLPVGLRHVYSQLQAWSFDEKHFLAIDILNGEQAVVLDASTLQEKVRINGGYGHRWLPQTNKVLYLDDDLPPAKIKLFDVETQQEETLNLPYDGIRAARCWEEVSRDGEWIAIYVDDPQTRVLTYNLKEKRVYVDRSIQDLGIGFEPDWVGVSPDGVYLAIQWISDGSGQARGLQLYDVQTGQHVRQVHEHHNHGDFGLDENGNAFYVSIELRHPNDNNNPAIFLYPLDGSPKRAVGTSIPWGRAEHLSAQGVSGSPVVITAGTQFSDDKFKGNIWLQHLDGKRDVLAEHNSNIGAGYYAQPQATMGIKSNKIAFATNNGGTLQDVRSVIISSSLEQVPTGSNPEPTGSTPEPTGSTPTPTGSSPEPTGSTPTPSGSVPVVSSSLGQNLAFLTYWTTSNAFLNLMKMCGTIGGTAPWLSSNTNTWEWNDNQPIDIDEDGYVRSLAANQFVRTLFPSGLGGDFVVSWEGEGHLQINGVGQNAINGRFEVSLAPKSQTELLIFSINTNNYPKNIRIVPKELENSNETFHPEFLKQLSGYKVLRTMDWMETNGSPLSQWSDRRQVSHISQGHGRGHGVSWEHQIELCNKIGADLWINIPHLADDDFIQKTAELIYNELNPQLKVYVEYSNECWNYGGPFSQTRWCDEQGQRLGLPGPDSHAQGRRFYARRTREIMEIFENVFGNETSNRVVRVIGGQNADGGIWVMENLMLPFENTHEHIDAIAIAPYFGYPYDNMLTEQEIIDLSPQDIEATLNRAKKMKQIADAFGKELITYEGGQHWLPSPVIHNDETAVQEMINANYNPQMEQLYKDYLNKWWNEVSPGVFVHFNFISSYTKWGAWGAAEHLDETDTPKMRALKSFLE